jgi:hypothetical protein
VPQVIDGRQRHVVTWLQTVAAEDRLLAAGSTVTSKYEARLAEATQTFAGALMPFTLWSRAQIMDLFDGLDLVEPGLVSLPEWRPDVNTDRTPLRGPTVGGVAQLRK